MYLHASSSYTGNPTFFVLLTKILKTNSLYYLKISIATSKDTLLLFLLIFNYLLRYPVPIFYPCILVFMWGRIPA